MREEERGGEKNIDERGACWLDIKIEQKIEGQIGMEKA